MKLKSVIFDENAINRASARIAHEIVERNESIDGIVLVGIKTRGVPLAQRLSDYIYDKIDNTKKIPVESLDITFYRDDLSKKNDYMPIVSKSNIETDINGKTVVLTDDVIYTGRTARAALEALFSFGRPAKIQLAVMVDRGHRELPVRPDFVGKNIPTSRNEIIKVEIKEIDGVDCIELYDK
ncbi:MAG: bifunctional pyr operon transcriptional regulator/uracil phosphoribosyltransferase PyrR [Clostridia bacterium]|nr:bifunctional pyr operon transcriptional regulator/uracil phosphoribosyltransferase PyrR [Clostridia bacterium]